MRWLHITDYPAGLSRLQQHNEHGQQNHELCGNCTCPQSWLCPTHDTHVPERPLKTTLYLSLPCLNRENSLWLTSVLSACSSYLQNDKVFVPTSVFDIVNGLGYFMCALCTGALGFLCMEIYNFASLLWQMGMKFNSVASLLVGRYLGLAESTFSGAEYRKKSLLFGHAEPWSKIYTPSKSLHCSLYVCLVS